MPMRGKFDQLNQSLRRRLVFPGELVIVGEASTRSRTWEERHLMSYAGDVRHSILSNGSTANDVMAQNFDLLQSIMTYSSIGIGSASGAWSKHLDEIKETLKDIESLHKRWRSGALTKDQFIAQRRPLFSKLDTQLEGVGRFGSGLKNERGIKSMLGISSKSYLHSGEIAGYANTVRGVSKMASISNGQHLFCPWYSDRRVRCAGLCHRGRCSGRFRRRNGRERHRRANRNLLIREHQLINTAYGMGLLGLCAAAIANALALLYVAKFKLDELEARLPRTKIVVDARRNWGSDNIRARLFRLNMVYISLMFPQHWSRRGLVDLQEIEELPRPLVLWVLIPGNASFLVLLGCIVFPKGA